METLKQRWSRLNKSKCMLYSLVVLTVVVTGILLFLNQNNSLICNLFTESLGILFTVFVVDVWFRASENEKWNQTDQKLKQVLGRVVKSIIYTVRFEGVLKAGVRSRVLEQYLSDVQKNRKRQKLEALKARLLMELESGVSTIRLSPLQNLIFMTQRRKSELEEALKLYGTRYDENVIRLTSELIDRLQSLGSILQTQKEIAGGSCGTLEKGVLEQITRNCANELLSTLDCCRQLTRHLG
jgi:hypothetical protein